MTHSSNGTCITEVIHFVAIGIFVVVLHFQNAATIFILGLFITTTDPAGENFGYTP